jgi:hypothetical protein
LTSSSTYFTRGRRDIEEARTRKKEVLTGQREGLEHAVASMASGSEHAWRTAKLGDEFEVMKAYSQVTVMRGYATRSMSCTPPIVPASIQFVQQSCLCLHSVCRPFRGRHASASRAARARRGPRGQARGVHGRGEGADCCVSFMLVRVYGTCGRLFWRAEHGWRRRHADAADGRVMGAR